MGKFLFFLWVLHPRSGCPVATVFFSPSGQSWVSTMLCPSVVKVTFPLQV